MTKITPNADITRYALTALATELLYTRAEALAALRYSDRKSRREHPPGHFDRAGRFYADERTESVLSCRSPSRAYPYPEMTAARTAAHCAELHDADNVTHVRRIATAFERLQGGATMADVRKLLMTGMRARAKAVPEVETSTLDAAA